MPPNDAEDENTTKAKTPTKGPAAKSSPAAPRQNQSKQSPNDAPKRKAAAAPKPGHATVPARVRANSKKTEATLLGDFLLGRPTPGRVHRRKSLDLVKAEMRAATVNKVQAPGGVKDRVKQWQKANAEAMAQDVSTTPSKGKEKSPKELAAAKKEKEEKEKLYDDIIVIEEEDEKSQASKSTRRAKSVKADKKDAKVDNLNPPSTPKKRVVSDDHWMNKPSSGKRKTSPKIDGGKSLPRDFVQRNALNPSVNNKIEDWVKRTTAGESTLEPRPTKRKPRPKPPEINTGKATTEDETEKKVKLFPAEAVLTSSAKKQGNSHRQSKEDLRVRREKKAECAPSQVSKTDESLLLDGDLTPTRQPARKKTPDSRKNSAPNSRQGSDHPDSAEDSTFDIPLGAEAGNMRPRPAPQRGLSLKVPKVLRMVYGEGIKAMDPPQRGGPNMPPSIESWLEKTDPFIDRDDVPESVVGVTRPVKRSTEDDNAALTETESVLSSEKSEKPRHGDSKRRSVSVPRDSGLDPILETTTPSRQKSRAKENSSASPSDLKRTPARRMASSPLKSGKRSSFFDTFAEAFKGESDARLPVSKTILVDAIDLEDHDEFPSPRQSPKPREDPEARFERDREDSQSPVFDLPHSRRPPPASGRRQLSTIASAETLSTESTETITVKSIARPQGSSLSRGKSNKHGLKRRLTKHSDLISVLSLPQTADQRRGGSIRSARSVRTTRKNLDTATIDDLFQELAEDEAKYARELRTLVDGVIPVLLKCVLSKSEAAIAAGLIDPTAELDDREATRPIVGMGIALERLKRQHRRVPFNDAERFLKWARDAHREYEDYLAYWRMGFQDVIVNLAPASRSRPTDSIEDGMSRNEDGDIIDKDGSRVDVAFLLKRPLVRIRYLAKLTKGLHSLMPSATTDKLVKDYDDLLRLVRLRTKEEQARLVDQAANNTDVGRVRDLRTLAPREHVTIDRTRQVCAKDFFSLDLQHSSGQRLDCRVEITLRDKEDQKSDPGDILICEQNTTSTWLLFPPIELDRIKAYRQGQLQLVITIRGFHNDNEWAESLLLTAEDEETVVEWLDLLGSTEMREGESVNIPATPTRALVPARQGSPQTPRACDVEIPIGARISRDKPEEKGSKTKPLKRADSDTEAEYKDFNDAMRRTGNKPAPSRYHTRTSSEPRNILSSEQQADSTRLPKVRHNSTDQNIPLKEAMRPSHPLKSKSDPAPSEFESVENDVPPPPPPHKAPSSPGLKSAPKLDPPSVRSKNRRTSSPLKHEYQPSDASETSMSEISASDSEYTDSYESVSSEDELSEDDASSVIHHPQRSPTSSIFSLPGKTLAPSNSASQGPYRSVPTPSPSDVKKLVASLSSWSDKHGRWEDLHPEDCSIAVSPGLIEAYLIDTIHNEEDWAEHLRKSKERPLIALELTPLVPLRQSNALDIEIRSPPTSRSLVKSSGVIRLRSRSIEECRELYLAIHRARLDNPTYKRLEQERMLSGYGTQIPNATSRRRSWFGRKNSYRASTRAPSEATSTRFSESSHASSFASAFSALRRLSGGAFNIAKSSIDTHGHGTISSASPSLYGSSSDSASGSTPPRSPSLATSQTSGAANEPLGSSNLKVRLYVLETASKWADLGSARLTVTQPAPGQRQASSLYHGIERRIIVTSKHGAAIDELPKDPETGHGVLLDVVLGGGCFSRIGVVGIAINVWEDIVGPNGEVGQAGAYGGVSGKTRKWMIQCQSATQARWIFALVGGGVA